MSYSDARASRSSVQYVTLNSPLEARRSGEAHRSADWKKGHTHTHSLTDGARRLVALMLSTHTSLTRCPSAYINRLVSLAVCDVTQRSKTFPSSLSNPENDSESTKASACLTRTEICRVLPAKILPVAFNTSLIILLLSDCCARERKVHLSPVENSARSPWPQPRARALTQ